MLSMSRPSTSTSTLTPTSLPSHASTVPYIACNPDRLDIAATSSSTLLTPMATTSSPTTDYEELKRKFDDLQDVVASGIETPKSNQT